MHVCEQGEAPVRVRTLEVGTATFSRKGGKLEKGERGGRVIVRRLAFSSICISGRIGSEFDEACLDAVDI
jgi:hypothetical protein